MNARGLTIIELLAGTVLLALLAAAVLPVVSGSTSEKQPSPLEPRVQAQVRATIEGFGVEALAETARTKSLTYTAEDGSIIQIACEAIVPETGRGTFIVIRHEKGFPMFVWSALSLEE